MGEYKIVEVRGGLHGLQGAQTQLAAEALAGQPVGTSWEAMLLQFYPKADQHQAGDPAIGYPNRRVLADGSYVLVSRAPRDLILHLHETLAAREYELMYAQLVSEALKQEYVERGLDPLEAGRYIVRNKAAIMEFLELMPAAERTPGVFLQSWGGQRYALRYPGAKQMGSQYSELVLVIEDGCFRLSMLQ